MVQHITGITEREDRKKGVEKIFEEIMAGGYTWKQRLKKFRAQEAWIITLRPLAYHIQIGKTNKNRENLENKEKRHINCTKKRIRIVADFLSQSMQTRRNGVTSLKWQN